MRDDEAGGRTNRRVTLRRLGIDAPVRLIGHARTKIVPFTPKATAVLERVRSGHDCLRLERRPLRSTPGSHLPRHDAHQVGFEWEFVDCEDLATPRVELDRAAIRCPVYTDEARSVGAPYADPLGRG